jgi:hypothetical protein
MRQLAESFFASSPVMAAPLIAMLIFMVVFGLVLVRVMRTRREELDRSARLPLEEAREEAREQGGDDV